MKEDLDRSVACEACFADETLVAWVKEHGKRGGPCPWCGARDVCVIAVEQLGPHFRNVAKIYSPSGGLSGDPLGYLMQEDFGLFSERIESDTDLRDRLAVAVVVAGLTKDDVDEPDYRGYFHRTSGLSEAWDAQIDALFRTGSVEETSSISPKNPNGFPDQFTIAVEDLSVRIPAGAELFRSRLHEERRRTEWYRLDEMGAPPADKALAQRANNARQPVLYLASDLQTALAEIRGWRGAAVAIARMEAKRDLLLVDLVTTPSIESPFFDESLGWRLELHGLLLRVAEEMSRPILPSDAETLYRTSRHFCDRVRELGMDGVIYPSALGPGKNVVVFDHEAVLPTSVEYIRITNVAFEHRALAPAEQPYDDLPWGFPD